MSDFGDHCDCPACTDDEQPWRPRDVADGTWPYRMAVPLKRPARVLPTFGEWYDSLPDHAKRSPELSMPTAQGHKKIADDMLYFFRLGGAA